METSILQGALLALTAIAAFTDLRRGNIPNWLTLPVIVLAPLAHLVAGGTTRALLSVAGVAIAGAVPLVFFLRRAMGGGDVKLFAAVGAIVGPGIALEVQLVSMVVAALFALGVLAYRGTLFATIVNVCIVAAGPFLPERFRRTRSPELTSTLRIGFAVFVGALTSVIAARTGALFA